MLDPQNAIEVLPHVRAYAFLELRTLPVAEPPAASTFSMSAALAYLLVAIVRTCLFDAFVFASIAACVLLASLLA